MRRPLVTTLATALVALGGLALVAGSTAAAAPPPPDGCTTPAFVSLPGQGDDVAPGTYSQAGPPAVSVTFGSLASRIVSFEVTTPGWRIFAADVGYVYDDEEGGPLGQAESHTYGTGVTSSSVTIGGEFPPGNGLLGWEGAFFQLFDCGAPPTTAATTTTTISATTSTTVAPAAPTTAAPTSSIAGAPAAPTTVRATLPATGGRADVSVLAVGSLLAGLTLLAAARRRTV